MASAASNRRIHLMFQTPFVRKSLYPLTCLLLAVCISLLLCACSSSDPVTLAETDHVYILDNGIVRAQIAKASGDIVSLRYQGQEMFATFLTEGGEPDLKRDPPGENLEGLNRGMTDHQYGFWSHDAMGKRGSGEAIAKVTIDPSANGGRRAEVSVRGISGGTRALGTGPGANRDNGDFFADVEIRYALSRGESGVYTYSIFEHKPGYPATSITEARFCMKLNDMFDWMLNDEKRNKLYLKEDHENKYNYTANQFQNRAFGWASTAKGIGCFLINPSMEYMSGGPTKVEFLTHRDTNEISAPCVLNYWRSSHYGGAMVSVREDEHWVKVIGPFMIYCNRGGDPQAILRDARSRQVAEEARWPFSWVDAPAYPNAGERGGVEGQLVLDDPLAPEGVAMSNVMVGLTAPDYEVPTGGPGGVIEIGWQRDAKYYQFWKQAQDDGTFEIPNVHPGTYTLRAFADGVLGEFAQANVKIEAGKMLDLGKIQWTPVRHGRQLWDIGIANRNSREFLKGDDYYHDGMQAMYAELFPDDVHYVVGKSDFTRDIYYQHVPHLDEEASAAAAEEAAKSGQRFFFGPPQVGRATPWTIEFDLPEAPTARRTILRLAISGTGARTIEAAVNGQPAGEIQLAAGDSTFSGRNGIQGIWYQRELAFHTSLLKAGKNTLTLTVPAGPVGAGVMDDYVRLELDESKKE
jgi:rhamnogalacturonan endolyase